MGDLSWDEVFVPTSSGDRWRWLRVVHNDGCISLERRVLRRRAYLTWAVAQGILIGAVIGGLFWGGHIHGNVSALAAASGGVGGFLLGLGLGLVWWWEQTRPSHKAVVAVWRPDRRALTVNTVGTCVSDLLPHAVCCACFSPNSHTSGRHPFDQVTLWATTESGEALRIYITQSTERDFSAYKAFAEAIGAPFLRMTFSGRELPVRQTLDEVIRDSSDADCAVVRVHRLPALPEHA